MAQGFHVTHAAGGQATSLEIHDGYWYQAIGDRLIVSEISNSDEVANLLLTTHLASGVCIDVLLDQQTLYALIAGVEIVVIDCSDPNNPVITQRISNQTLGIEPFGLSFIGSRPAAYGKSGVVRLSDNHRLVTSDGVVTSAALSINKGVVFVKDSQLIVAKTNDPLCDSTGVYSLEGSSNVRAGTLLSAIHEQGQLSLHLINADGSYVDQAQGVLKLQCKEYTITAKGNRLLVATEHHIHIIGIGYKEMRLVKSLQIQGVWDLGIVGSNYLAVCGKFGRGLYRIESDKGGKGETLFRVRPAAGVFSVGHAYQKYVQIPNTIGSATYTFGESIQYTDETIDSMSLPKSAVIMGWIAAIDPNSQEVFVVDSKNKLLPLPIPPAFSICSIAGNFWIGTSDGLYIYGDDGNKKLTELDSVTIGGPVIQCIGIDAKKTAFITATGFAGLVETN